MSLHTRSLSLGALFNVVLGPLAKRGAAVYIFAAASLVQGGSARGRCRQTSKKNNYGFNF